jgi:hypothetical protein
MAVRSLDEIPQSERDRIADEVRHQLDRMDASTRRARYATSESLGEFIAQTARAFAALLGYTIALPIAWGVRFVEELGLGFEEGWKAGWESASRKS